MIVWLLSSQHFSFIDKKTVLTSPVQVLELAEEPSCLIAEQYAFHRQLAAAALLVYRHLCSAWYATVWRKVQLWWHAGNAEKQLWHLLAVTTNCLPSTFELLCNWIFRSKKFVNNSMGHALKLKIFVKIDICYLAMVFITSLSLTVIKVRYHSG